MKSDLPAIQETLKDRPQVKETILQFGEGNFLRAFVDWMIDILNQEGHYRGSVVMVQPIAQGMGEAINRQKGLYTTYLRGLRKGKALEESRLITAVSRCINPYADHQAYIDAGNNPDLRFIISNTTEAGISFHPGDRLEDQPQQSYPGKLTALLYRRFTRFSGDPDKGLVIIPCELIDRNGDRLRDYVRQYAEQWNLGADFLTWLDSHCDFLNSLVDRIVTGYPGEEAPALWETLGYRDDLLVTGELFHLWVIEGSRRYAMELPFQRAGLDVIWTEDMTPYRTRKVRILNGVHTMTALTSFLYGLDTVGQWGSTPDISRFVDHAIFKEIIPACPGVPGELEDFAREVIQRFANPYIVHQVLSISLNSVSKFTTRVLPSLLDYHRSTGSLPQAIPFSLAGLLAFYQVDSDAPGSWQGMRGDQPYPVKDDPAILEAFADLYAPWTPQPDATETLVRLALSRSQWWGTDLSAVPGLVTAVSGHLHRILTQGMKTALGRLLSKIDSQSREIAPRIRRIHPGDTVVVAVDPVPRGTVIEVPEGSIEAGADIPQGHKIAIRAMAPGDPVVKYGFPMGRASTAISPGDHVHTHNVKTGLEGTLEYRYRPGAADPAPGSTPAPHTQRSFQGYVREDGSVGIRNEIWIIPTVGCVNRPAELMAQRAIRALGSKIGPNIDAIVTHPHPYGCSQLGDDHLMTQKILADLVHHPNAGGVLVFGLGCENNYIEEFKKVLGPHNEKRVKFLSAQDTSDEIDAGMQLLEELVDQANQDVRQSVPLEKLIVGLKCGGSDGFSGLSANPLLGQLSDALIDQGGTTILTEVPEMFGAETILMDRAESREVFEDVVGLINGFKEYYLRYNQVVYENPSPGNKEGGITTLEEKSLGCVQKGGRSPVRGVLKYGQRITTHGLNLLEGPGNDIVSVTALAAAGAHLVLFTTGRGTPLGGPVPTVKVSSNTALAEKKPGWIDFNAGPILDGRELTEEFLDFVVDIASGTQTRNELNGYREIAIFKDGVTL
ncbi:tagaturonate reductase [Spirochaeta lutea]|uniref:tagaturonate reductase n=1 Tax=Spirochaeta lutea TaxID=1480694 RepID=UPI0009DFF288|nr:tagaturonate reductase [Spirochaeta lutea]